MPNDGFLGRFVMLGLDPGIHVLLAIPGSRAFGACPGISLK